MDNIINFNQVIQTLRTTQSFFFKLKDFSRARKLSCELVVGILLCLCHQRNKNGYQIGIDSFIQQLNQVDPRYDDLTITAQAFSKARKKLPYEVLENLCVQTSKGRQTDSTNFKGFQIYAIDGTGFATPDTEELNQHFNKHRTYGAEGYYPQGNLVAAVHVASKTIAHAMIDCLHSSEKGLTECIVDNFDQNSIFVLDRGLASQNIFLKIFNNRQHFVTRIRDDKAALKVFQNFSESFKRTDYIQLKNGVPLRLEKVKIKAQKRPILVATTLPESVASRKKLAEIYDSRWEVETVFDYIKNVMSFDDFHARDFNGVMQEIYANFILNNLSANTYEEETTQEGQVSRKSAINHFGQRILHLLILPLEKICQHLKCELRKLGELLERSRRRKRPGRSYPRISKKPPNKWRSGKNRKKELQRVRGLS